MYMVDFFAVFSKKCFRETNFEQSYQPNSSWWRNGKVIWMCYYERSK